MRYRFLLFLLLITGAARAQLTVTLTSVPANTPVGATIYIAGTFNSWNPRAAGYALAPQGGGQYAITLPTTVRGAISFKFTLGVWDSCEATAGGGQAPDRNFTVPATGTASYSGTVPAWTMTSTPASTASASVSVLSTSFTIPQLNRTRTIRLYLPPDYATSGGKTYPVLYMHDGQNLFDNATAFSGEWGVDETLDRLQTQANDWGCIVIGIDNGPQRLDEYSPYVNAQYGGGQGDAYVDFIAIVLKPYVDGHYRTRPDRLSTGIMGSSMGGLISLYAGLKYPEVFGRVGALSASLWFSPRIYAYAHHAPFTLPDPRLWFSSGTAESGTQVAEQQRMLDTLALAGFDSTELRRLVVPGAQHNEAQWRAVFPQAYAYLFAGTATEVAYRQAAGFSLAPNPGSDRLTIRMPDETQRGMVEVYNATGRLVLTGKLHQGKAELDTHELAAGLYTVRVGEVSRTWVRT